jgi:hypothetical protein
VPGTWAEAADEDVCWSGLGHSKARRRLFALWSAFRRGFEAQDDRCARAMRGVFTVDTMISHLHKHSHARNTTLSAWPRLLYLQLIVVRHNPSPVACRFLFLTCPVSKNEARGAYRNLPVGGGLIDARFESTSNKVDVLFADANERGCDDRCIVFFPAMIEFDVLDVSTEVQRVLS